MSSSEVELNKPKPFVLHAEDALLSLTKQKLQLARYPEELEDIADDDWSHGAKVKHVKELAGHWRDGFDWRKQEAQINADFKQYKVKIDVPDYGHLTFHYAHHPSTFPNALPLLFVSGWPSSFLEARQIIQPLTSPSEEGTQAFHFVVISIPGFGPGDPATKSTLCPTTVAKAFKIIMVDVLGYRKFVTQGGDFGSYITHVMAQLYPEHVKACHTNLIMKGPPAFYKNPLVFGRLILNSLFYTSEEKRALEQMQKFQKEGMAYAMVQGTRPQSLGFGLGDSPIGLLAWMVEKFHDWMDIENYVIPRDEMITAVMMHWIWGGTPGFRLYKAMFKDETAIHAYDKWCSTPYGYSQFRKDVIQPPLDWIRPTMNLQWYKRHEKGGHFASIEQPELLVQDMREWFGSDIVKKALS